MRLLKSSKERGESLMSVEKVADGLTSRCRWNGHPSDAPKAAQTSFGGSPYEKATNWNAGPERSQQLNPAFIIPHERPLKARHLDVSASNIGEQPWKINDLRFGDLTGSSAHLVCLHCILNGLGKFIHFSEDIGSPVLVGCHF
jgi:hypothetical protein